jgi:alkanesulfonate monooxygenase SsuD/methylene tetrahydromethanopterin reductase-like flavin-dependent oxidoreductase (luciferase family)
MAAFDPTPPPPGRLLRLGVVLDLAEPIDRLRGLAILCDRAGIDAVWLADRMAIDVPSRWADPADAAAVVATALGRARLGVLLGGAPGSPGSETLRPAPPAAQEVCRPGDAAYGRSETGPRRSAIVNELAQLVPLFAAVDDVVLPGWAFPDLETAADEVRAEAAEHGRDPRTLGVAALITVSVGRTQAEAQARAIADPLFDRLGHPRDTGIFGTLEECQDRAIALAHAGVTDLRCILPASVDVHDVIAQLTAIAVGTTDVLRPGSLRSPAPAPPVGWGGRPDAPPRPRLSGGSRRR